MTFGEFTEHLRQS